MKLIFIVLFILSNLIMPVKASEYRAPDVPPEAENYMPDHTESFGEGLWEILKFAVSKLHPAFAEAASVCTAVIAVTLLISLMEVIPGTKLSVTNLIGNITIGLLFLKPANALVRLGTETIELLYEYGKLLLPVMTSALAAQGGVTKSAILYTGTSFFCTLLTGIISRLIVPLIYVYLCLSIACSALSDETLKNLSDFAKWLMTWILKTVLYVFTGFLTISGIIGGTADVSAVKAAKLAISGMIPVVGNILSDASETILLSAGIMKNSAGIYGILALTAIGIGPVLKIGVQYLLTKISAAICSVTGSRDTANLVNSFAGSMGVILAMTGSTSLLLVISTVCFMKGVII